MTNCISYCIKVRHGIVNRLQHVGAFLFVSILLLLICVTTVQAGSSKPPQHILSQDSAVALQQMFSGVEFRQPLGMLQIPASNDNWFVLEKEGRILRVFNAQGRWRSEILLDIHAQVDSSSEGGLLGATFHPDIKQKQHLFVSYTKEGSANNAAMHSILSRFNLSKDLQLIDNKTEKIILLTDQPYGNHNGGHIAFSSQGHLYYGLGDGGAGGDPHANGQNKSSLLGSMLRIDVSTSSKRAELVAWGFRNPWRWSFDRLTGELWLADVGQNEWEEVNRVEQGGNYGWNVMEGRHCFNASSCQKNPFRPPVLEYAHLKGRCSITGGYVYRGKQIKSLYGMYVYGDFCSGEIWRFSVDSRPTGGKQLPAALLLNTEMNISSFAEDNSGELYVIDITGHIYKLIPQDSL